MGILGSDAKYHVACVGRQFGKSMMAMNLVLYWGINDGPCKILWVSPVYSQTEKVQKELMQAIGASGIVKTCNYSSNNIVLKNGTEIIFRSAERYDNIRGLTVDYGVIDEAAFCKDDAWTEAIRPVFLTTKGKILFVSTPKGKNWFYNLFQLGISQNHPNYVSYTGSSYDTPFIEKSEIEDARQTLPERVFEQEYLAKFIEAGGEVFANIDKNCFDSWPKSSGPYFAGIDLGKQEDYTVMTVMDKRGQVVEIYRNNKTEWSQMTRDMVQIARKWNASCLMEINSIGDVIFEAFKKEYSNTHPFVTSSKSKNEIIEGLILDMNQTEVMIPSEKLFSPLYNELQSFTYQYNPKTRSIRYGHVPGLHDDTVMSLAIANYQRKTQANFGTYNYVANSKAW